MTSSREELKKNNVSSNADDQLKFVLHNMHNDYLAHRNHGSSDKTLLGHIDANIDKVKTSMATLMGQDGKHYGLAEFMFGVNLHLVLLQEKALLQNADNPNDTVAAKQIVRWVEDYATHLTSTFKEVLETRVSKITTPKTAPWWSGMLSGTKVSYEDSQSGKVFSSIMLMDQWGNWSPRSPA